MNDIFTYITDLPYSIAGYTISNSDSTYTIVLNARMTHERRVEAYNHELRHILKNDFEKCDVQEIEAVAHGIAGGEFP